MVGRRGGMVGFQEIKNEKTVVSMLQAGREEVQPEKTPA